MILPVCYARTWGAPIELLKTIENGYGKLESPALYVTAIILYLVPDALGVVMFCFPALRRHIEQADHVVIKVLLWWAQVRLMYVWIVYSIPCFILSKHPRNMQYMALNLFANLFFKNFPSHSDFFPINAATTVCWSRNA